MAEATIEVFDDTFADEVLESPIPVLVDFWAEWCGPCLQVAPALEELASEYADRIKIAKLNVEVSPETAEKYGIVSIPTMHLFRNGEIIHSILGARPKSALATEIERAL